MYHHRNWYSNSISSFGGLPLVISSLSAAVPLLHLLYNLMIPMRFLFYPEDGSSKSIRNVGIYIPHHTVSRPKRRQTLPPPLYEPQTWQCHYFTKHFELPNLGNVKTCFFSGCMSHLTMIGHVVTFTVLPPLTIVDYISKFQQTGIIFSPL